MIRRKERSLLSVPVIIIAGFVVALGLQIITHQYTDRDLRNEYKPLSRPFSADTYRGLSMGSEQLFSYLLSIKLQLHDNQAGKHILYRFVNYELLIAWLKTIQVLNPGSEYTIFLASRNYSQTPEKHQLKMILEYIDSIYSGNPALFWRHQAEATVIAKHKLGDLEFALVMAEKLFNQPEAIAIPRWARDMHLLLLADLNEFESSIIIIQSILQSGTVKDPDELRFLEEKLSYFRQKLFEYRQQTQ